MSSDTMPLTLGVGASLVFLIALGLYGIMNAAGIALTLLAFLLMIDYLLFGGWKAS